MRLVLASASPRRAELLRAAGFSFEVLAVDLDERAHDGEAPSAYVARLARHKAGAAMQRFEERAQRSCHGPERAALDELVVLGADTAVVVDGVILGKPRDDHHAAAMRTRGRVSWMTVVVSTFRWTSVVSTFRWTSREC